MIEIKSISVSRCGPRVKDRAGTNLATMVIMDVLCTYGSKWSIGTFGRFWQFAVIVYFVSLLTDLNAATITAASPSLADVQAAYNTAARGDTVAVPAGSATWTGTLTLAKGIRLMGAGRDSLTITRTGGTAILIQPDSTAITNEEMIRVEGFTFIDSSNYMIQVVGAAASATKPFKNLAIGNNRFKDGTTTTSGSGVISIAKQVRGAIFSNIFDRCNVILKNIGNDDTTEWSNGHFPFAYGNSDNLFFENNTIQYSSSFSGDDPGWFETGQGQRLVARYNTFNFANTTCSEYWDIHGFQNWPGGQTGTMITEYYGNTLTNTSGYAWVVHRGSWGLFFNNIMTGSNGGAINAQQYGVGDIGGSGCTAQVPGATGVYTCEINNTYVFNNSVNGSIKNMGPGAVYGCGIAENANYWNYNASFNGSTGIGRGTVAPTGNCTVGVAYWKCGTATPTVNPAVVQTGHLYKCFSTNVWTDYYTPYTYPHPLASGSPAPTPTPASTPTGTPAPTPTATATPANTPTPTPFSTPTPTPLGTSFNATQGIITNPFVVGSNAISQPILTIDPAQGGKALYSFNVPVSGDYSISAIVNCPDEGSNSLFVNIDAEPSSAMLWNIPVTSGFEVRIASWSPSTTPKAWTLTAGTHQLIFRGREADTALQRITLAIAPNAPNSLHVVP